MFEDLAEKRRSYVDPEMGCHGSIINQQGQLTVSTVAVAELPRELSDRETFRHHRRDPTDNFFVGTPIPMRVANEWRIPFTRPLLDGDGGFKGLIGFTILPSYFSRFYKKVDLGAGSAIALGRNDGYVLARHPHPELALGSSIEGALWTRNAPSKKGTFRKHSQVDKIERLYAWQAVERGNLVALMGKSAATILGPYYHQRTVYSTGGTTATLLLALVAYLWGRYQRHHAQAETELQKMGADLAHSQKPGSIGKLAGGVTRDFNHVLPIITNNPHLIESAPPGSCEIRAYLESITAATEQGRKMAAQLLTFARRQPLHPTAIDMAQLLGRNDGLIEQLAGPGVKVQMNVAESLWHTRADAGLLENVILNLDANARDAMNGQGTLRISASNMQITPPQGMPCAELQPGGYVLLMMTEAGCGMSRETLEHVFEPFFTAKQEGKGTGLGLSMASGFVKESGGHIDIDSTPGSGATIRLMLPRTLKGLPAPSGQAPVAATGGT